MSFSTFFFTFTIMATAGFCLESKNVGVFEQSFEDYKSQIFFVRDLIARVINETKFSTRSLYIHLNDHLLSLQDSVMKEDCRNIFYTKSFKEQFETHLLMLEEPFLKSMVEMKHSLESTFLSIGVYKAVADAIMQSCLILTSNYSNCQEKAASWLEEKLTSLQCQLLPDCYEHVIHKREIFCPPGYFQCSDGACIIEEYACRGAMKCSDENEMPPDCYKFCFNGFRCRNMICIDKQLTCDKVNDCGDNSDEEGCTPKIAPFSPSNCSMNSGDFICTNGECIPVDRLCNNQEDCEDGSDEGGFCESGCPEECGDQGGVCFSHPKGPLCLNRCPQGFVEIAGSCQASQGLNIKLPSNIKQLVKDVPRILARYQMRISLLQQQMLEIHSKSLQELSICVGLPFLSHEKIFRLPIKKDKSSVTTSPMP